MRCQRDRRRHGADVDGDPELDRDGKHESPAVVGVLADQVDPARRPDRERRLSHRAHRNARLVRPLLDIRPIGGVRVEDGRDDAVGEDACLGRLLAEVEVFLDAEAAAT